MALLKPTISVKNIGDINLELLNKLNVKLILLDVDNTIASYLSKEPVQGSIEWIKTLQNAGYTVYIVSNNYEKRVCDMAKKFNVPYISLATKPFTRGFNKAKRVLKVKKSDCLVVGDQIFTDILGANLAGMKSVLLTPIEMEKGFSIELRRRLEKKTRSKLEFYQD